MKSPYPFANPHVSPLAEKPVFDPSKASGIFTNPKGAGASNLGAVNHHIYLKNDVLDGYKCCSKQPWHNARLESIKS